MAYYCDWRPILLKEESHLRIQVNFISLHPWFVSRCVWVPPVDLEFLYPGLRSRGRSCLCITHHLWNNKNTHIFYSKTIIYNSVFIYHVCHREWIMSACFYCTYYVRGLALAHSTHCMWRAPPSVITLTQQVIYRCYITFPSLPNSPSSSALFGPTTR